MMKGNDPVTHASATKQKKRQTYKPGGFWMDGMRYKIRWDRIAASAGVGALLAVLGVWALEILVRF